jgi:hypothetical protein
LAPTEPRPPHIGTERGKTSQAPPVPHGQSKPKRSFGAGILDD